MPVLLEQPVLKLQFLTPDGDIHHSIITSTWRQSVGFTENAFMGRDEHSVLFRRTLTEAVTHVCEALGMTFHTLGFIESPEVTHTMTEACPAPVEKPTLRLIQGGRVVSDLRKRRRKSH